MAASGAAALSALGAGKLSAALDHVVESVSTPTVATIVLIGVVTGIYSAGFVNAVCALLSGGVLLFCSGVALAGSAGGSMDRTDEDRLEMLVLVVSLWLR